MNLFKDKVILLDSSGEEITRLNLSRKEYKQLIENAVKLYIETAIMGQVEAIELRKHMDGCLENLELSRTYFAEALATGDDAYLTAGLDIVDSILDENCVDCGNERE